MAGSGRVYTFFVVKQEGRPDRVVVWDTQDISLGRAPENDIAVEDAEISRQHARFVRSDSAFGVQNLSTSNGTLVNGQEVDNRALKNRDVVSVGGVELTFFQVARNPATLGLKLDYASGLKNFGPAGLEGQGGEATILGLVDTLPGADSDESFVVRPAGAFEHDLQDMQQPEPERAPRNLDLELDETGLHEPSTPAVPARSRSATGGQAPRLDAFTVNEAAPGTISLTFEIQGLTPEQGSSLAALLGKVIELPRLRIRIKGEDAV